MRCARRHTPRRLPGEPLAALVGLAIDGEDVRPTSVTKTRPGNGAPEDYFYRHLVAGPAPGRHTAEAVVRVLATGQEVRRAIDFGV